MANKQMLIQAAEKFINKVESGRAHSKETYAELKAALEANENENQYKTADEFIDNYMNNPIADRPGMGFHLKNAFNAGFEAMIAIFSENKNIIEVPLLSLDFEENWISFQLTAEQMEPGFRCGTAVIDLTKIR